MLSSPCPACGAPCSITDSTCPNCRYDFEKTKLQQRQDIKPATAPAPPVDAYYIMMKGQKSGVYALTQLRSMWNSGLITADALYCREGMDAWQPILNLRHMLDTAPVPHQIYAAPAPYYGMPAYPQAYVRPSKSRVAYIILALFFGCLGIHNFYAGRSGVGLAQLLITVFLGWLFIGIVITAFWALIEIIAVDRDGYGVRMT